MHARAVLPALLAVSDSGVVDRTELLALGLTDDAIAGLVGRGLLSRLQPGVYAVTRDRRDEHLQAVRAVLRANPHAVASHRSAAALHVLPLWAPPARPECIVPLGASRPRRALVRERRLTDAEQVTVEDMAVTSLVRTLVDLALALPACESVGTLDAAVRSRRVTPTQLLASLEARGDVNGRRRAAEVLLLTSDRADNVFESWSRLRLVEGGLPVPLVQPALLAGGVWLRPDLMWPQWGIVGEADGRLKYADADVLWAEKRRQELLESLGLAVLRWTFEEMVGHPNRVIARWRRLAARRGTFTWPPELRLDPDRRLPPLAA